MKQSEVRKQGKEIIETVFAAVIVSDNKELWKKAITSIHNHIARLEQEVPIASANDAEEANHLVRQLWYWNNARRQMCNRFGKKFISSLPPSNP